MAGSAATYFIMSTLVDFSYYDWKTVGVKTDSRQSERDNTDSDWSERDYADSDWSGSKQNKLEAGKRK
jgi:hypothetical protein